MTRILIGDAHLNVEQHGEPGSGTPLLLLHGFTGSATSWGSVVEALQPRWTIAVDAFGHGLSDSPADPRRYAMERAVGDVAVVLDRLGVERADVLGYSMGGRLALGVAILAPDRVRRLVLESASPGLQTERERAERVAADEALAARIERDGVAPFVEYWERLPLFASQARLPRETRDAVRARRLQNDPLGLANSLRGMGSGAQPSFWERLGEVRAPTLLVTGADDAKFCGIAAAMRDRLGCARWEVVPGAGHAVHLEQPRRFAELVLEHLGHAESAAPNSV